LGLAIVQAVMTSHGESIRLLPSDPGVAFELQFPAHSVFKRSEDSYRFA
jgi:two-component system, OmpR family, sensor histidine kinase CreC